MFGRGRAVKTLRRDEIDYSLFTPDQLLSMFYKTFPRGTCYIVPASEMSEWIFPPNKIVENKPVEIPVQNEVEEVDYHIVPLLDPSLRTNLPDPPIDYYERKRREARPWEFQG